jgi:hypothetical protein
VSDAAKTETNGSQAAVAPTQTPQEKAVSAAAASATLLSRSKATRVSARHIPEVCGALAGVGEDNAVLCNAMCCSQLQLLDAGTVKPCTQRCQHGDHTGLWVALDGIIGHHAGHGAHPGVIEAGDL